MTHEDYIVQKLKDDDFAREYIRVHKPIIRCKDCKFGKWCSYVDMNGETETVIVCQAYEVQKDIDGFCDEGERRGEEDE